MVNPKKLNMKDLMREGKERSQSLPAAQEPVAAPAKSFQLEQMLDAKRLMLTRTDEPNYLPGATFTMQNDVLALLDATVGGGFIADRFEWLIKLGIATDIAYMEKTGDMLARSNTEGFHGTVHSDLVKIFEDEEAVALVEAYFDWAKTQTAAAKSKGEKA